MVGLLAPLIERFERDLARVAAGVDARPVLRSGTVTAVDPVRVHLDGDPDPLPASPRTLTTVGPGDRVMVAHQKRAVTILGVTGPAGRPWRQAAGQVTVPLAGDWHTVTFPAGRFTLPPIVTATVVDDAGAAQGVVLRAPVSSPTQMRIHAGDLTGAVAAQVLVHWTAVQMSPTSAGG